MLPLFEEWLGLGGPFSKEQIFMQSWTKFQEMDFTLTNIDILYWPGEL